MTPRPTVTVVASPSVSTQTPVGSSPASSVHSSPTPRSRWTGADVYAPRSRSERSVNSQPGRPLKLGSSSPAWSVLANRALHLELDQAVHFHRVLHRELL